MATTTAPVTPSDSFIFDDIFQEFSHELEEEVNQFHWNQFYLNLNDELNVEMEDNPRPTFHQIPDYLQASNSEFQVAFFSELRRYYQPIHFQDLQQFAFLTHRLSIIRLHQRLWQRLLQTGTGQLKQLSFPCELPPPPPSSSSTLDPNLYLPFWSEIVTSAMIAQGLLCNNIDNDDDDSMDIDQEFYVSFVQNYLAQLEINAKQYQYEYDTMKQQRLPTIDHDTFDDKIDRFVEKEGIRAMEYYFQIRMTLLEYNCLDRSCLWKYFQEKPTPNQLELAKRICSLTFEKEKAEEEMILFKSGVIFSRLPKSLDHLEVSPPASITTISDSTLRERLSTQYIRIIQRAKADLVDVLTIASEAKRNDCDKKYDQETSDIWKNQRQLPANERLTSTMVAFIEQRQKLIITCLKRIYQLKDNFILYAPRKTSMN